MRTISVIAALILAAGSCVALKPGSTGYSATWLSVLGVSVGGWTVAQISNALSWWEVDELTGLSDGANVPELFDSISSLTLSQTTTANQPDYETAELNGLPILRFDGTEWLTNNSALFNYTSGSFSVAVVWKIDAEGSGKNRIIGNEGNQVDGWGLSWNTTANTLEFITNQSGARQISGTSVLSLSQWYIAIVTRSGSTATLYIDGTDDTQTAASHINPASAQSPLTLGAYPFDLNPIVSFRGDIAEVFIVSDAISQTDRQLAEGYLAHKWGLSANLPVSHPYKSSPP